MNGFLIQNPTAHYLTVSLSTIHSVVQRAAFCSVQSNVVQCNTMRSVAQCTTMYSKEHFIANSVQHDVQYNEM